MRQALLLLLVGVAWWLVYTRLAAAASWLTSAALGLSSRDRLGSAVEFFLYEAPKVLMLLTPVVFGVGIVRSFFTPERTRRVLAGKREGVRSVSAPMVNEIALALLFGLFGWKVATLYAGTGLAIAVAGARSCARRATAPRPR